MMKMKHGMEIVGLALLTLGQTGCFKSFLPDRLTSKSRIDSPSVSMKNDKELPTEDAAEVWITLGQKLESKGHHANAIAAYEKARQLNPEYREKLAHRLAVLYDINDDAKRAQDEFEVAVSREPKNADLLNDYGYSYYNRGQWAQAEELFRKALAIQPKHERACINLGMALAQQDKTEEALREFEKVVSPAEAQANLGFLLLARGKKDDARMAYLQARSLDPTLKNVMNALDQLDKADETLQTQK